MPNDPSSQESSKPKRMQYSLKRMLSNEAKNNNMYNVYFKSMPLTQNAGNLKCKSLLSQFFFFLYLAIFTHLNNKYRLQLSTILISNVHRLCRDFATPCALRKISSYPAFFLPYPWLSFSYSFMNHCHFRCHGHLFDRLYLSHSLTIFLGPSLFRPVTPVALTRIAMSYELVCILYFNQRNFHYQRWILLWPKFLILKCPIV